jgi:hypothetical protein
VCNQPQCPVLAHGHITESVELAAAVAAGNEAVPST